MTDSTTTWYVYMMRCADNSLYTGITTDLQRREQQHNRSNGKPAAKYTRTRQPVKLVYAESQPDRSVASQREYQLKQLTKLAKEKLVKQYTNPIEP